MTSMRVTVYAISAAAIAWFFLFPRSYVSLTGAMLLQTLAYTAIAGKSAADAIILSGISMLLIGFLPEGHPMLRGPFFDTVRLWVIGAGMILLLTGLSILALNRRARC